MAQLEIYSLNIEASPHPEGVYARLLRRASTFAVKARGSDFAKLTRPYNEGDNTFSGRVLVWTEIDVDGRWLDLRLEDDLPPELRGEITIPDNAKPNFRVFWYVFDEEKHLFYYESRNERGERLGPTTAERILRRLFSAAVENDKSIDVSVTLIPDEEAVRRILNLPGLKRLHIRLNRPNPDDFDEPRRRLLRELQKNSARRIDTEYLRAPEADRLTPTPAVEELATVASESGFVEGEGDSDGLKRKVSTKEHPRKVILDLEPDHSVKARLVAFARTARRGIRPRG